MVIGKLLSYTIHICTCVGHKFSSLTTPPPPKAVVYFSMQQLLNCCNHVTIGIIDGRNRPADDASDADEQTHFTLHRWSVGRYLSEVMQGLHKRGVYTT